jgi:imidazolonepropionase-like amidohydrolase
MANTLFTNVQVFDGNMSQLFPGEVLVQGNRIRSVARTPERLPRDGATIVDAGGATLMPGLVNVHSHFTYNNGPDVKGLTALPVEEHVVLALSNVKLLLDCGFTALVGAASAKPRLDVVVRNSIEKGMVPGPRILAGSPELTVTGGLADDRQLGIDIPSISVIADGADEFRRMTRLLIREGCDVIKFNNSGDSFCYPRCSAEQNPMTAKEVRAICETAKGMGKLLAAHAHADKSVAQCLDEGVDLIYHATFASDRTIERLARAAERHWVAPAIAARYNTTYEASDWGITTEVAEAIGNKRELESGIATMRKMHAAGIRVLPFGDYGFAWIPHGTDTRDFEHFVNLFGFAPWEVLRAATAYGGEVFAHYRGEQLGQIREGFLADILLIDGNPLLDVTLFQDRNNILAIMKDGAFHKPFARAGVAREALAA